MFANNLFYVFKAADIVFINYYNRHIGQWRKDNEKKGKRLCMCDCGIKEKKITWIRRWYLSLFLIINLPPDHHYYYIINLLSTFLVGIPKIK